MRSEGAAEVDAVFNETFAARRGAVPSPTQGRASHGFSRPRGSRFTRPKNYVATFVPGDEL